MMTYYKQPIDIKVEICPITGDKYEYAIWSEEDISEGNVLLEEILQRAEENNVKPQYYIQEFI